MDCEIKDIFEEGATFDTGGQLRLVHRIATGGMGTVYKAALGNVEGFEKIVAVKTLNTSLNSDSKCIGYFINEAKLVSHLCHENIVQLYNLGKHESSYYMVYEYISGATLHEFIACHNLLSRKIPESYTLFIVSRIARGLAYAHTVVDSNRVSCGIVHRDVCPKNIMLTTEGQPKLTDFGIAITHSYAPDDALSGKPIYMSPEQASKKELDFRSDIYSLGVVLFYMLTGYPTRDVLGGISGIISQAVEGSVDWKRFPCEENLHLYDILRKMLSADPVDRYNDTNDLVYDLEQYIYYKGYRTTISTMSEYLHLQMPYIFSHQASHAKPELHPELNGNSLLNEAEIIYSPEIDCETEPFSSVLC